MARMLFVVPPLTGHVAPLAAVAQHLVASGHTVRWCGDPALIRSLAGAQAQVVPCPGHRIAPAAGDLRGYAAVRQLWQEFLIPLADATTDQVVETARDFRPDIVVSDMQALAGPLAAARLGLPWATSATTSAPLRDSFAATPKVREWLDGLFQELIDRHASDAARRLTPGELELSPHLAVAFTTSALLTGGELAPQVRCVGPAVGNRDDRDDEFPWTRLDGRPLLLVTLGSVHGRAGARFLEACAEAVALLDGRVQAVIGDPGDTLARIASSDVVTAPYLPMVRLLRRAAAVICHGGHNTVCESLAHGVPLVVAPIRDDQPVIAEQVTEAGAGVRVRYTRATAEVLHDAVVTVLDDQRIRAGAATVQRSFAAAGSAPAAADHLLALAGAA